MYIRQNVKRSKIPPGIAQKEALVYAKRLTGPEAKRLQFADVLTEEAKMPAEARVLISGALGRNGISRELLQNTKTDMYGTELHHIISKL
ncbi:hypothetical protein MAR_026501 [Mya arenaria]|uniref:Uncharacterized protein n=1 Tax=Mya arenaria TaxID=6604 RepID=A0ABY7EUD8_MYAAR|nr:hypothetical protein MAR_026501 [Mya arenaria]